MSASPATSRRCRPTASSTEPDRRRAGPDVLGYIMLKYGRGTASLRARPGVAAPGDPEEPSRHARGGPRPVAGHPRLRTYGHSSARAGAHRGPRRRTPRRARAGQDPLAAYVVGAARRVVAGDRRFGAQRAPVRPDHGRISPPRDRAGRRAAGGLASPLRALLGEARHAGHLRRRPDRRRRPDEGGRGTPPRRPGDHPLRPDPAQPPRHRRHQRAARPRRADPGRDAQRDGGARHPDPRLRAAAAARRPRRRLGQPRGLHQPRPHHHAR